MSHRLLSLVRSELSPLSAYKAFAKSFPAKLDANESPWPLPAAARARIAEVLSELPYHRYPDAGAHALRKALASHLGATDPDTLVLGVGSDEVLAMLMRAMSEPRPGRHKAAVLFPEPSFVMYQMRSVIEDMEPVVVPLDARFQLDVDAMLEAIARREPNLVFLASPNNPTGNAFIEADVVRVIEAAKDALVILDEAYGAFSGKTLAHLAARYDNVALMGTLSKIGMAALRVGWAQLPRALADEIEKVRQPYNLSSPSQAVATLALTELWPTLEAHIGAIVEERARLADSLARFDALTVFPSDANFFLVRYDDYAEALATSLLAQGVSVRAFKGKGPLSGHLRITVGTPEENQRLIAALDELLSA
jgi:histidinol-phosphate aminotransferase